MLKRLIKYKQDKMFDHKDSYKKNIPMGFEAGCDSITKDDPFLWNSSDYIKVKDLGATNTP